jgi:RNA polymerase sigma-70 factor, ECF subfamily
MQDGGQALTEHLPRMYRVALRYVGDAERAEEVVQEACLRALELMKGFEGRASLTTWLHRVTVNCSIDFLRKHIRTNGASTSSLDEVAGLLVALDGTPAARAERRELYEIARALVDDLPRDCRTAFVLTQLDGYSYDEAAAIEGEPRGTIASRVYRAKKLLLAAMAERT